MHAGWAGGLFHSLAGQPTPRGYLHNGDRTYGALSTRAFPGGTVYVPGTGDIHYPEGSSWSTIQRAQFVTFDAMASLMGLDELSTVPASEWLPLHLEAQRALQARHADGRTYREATEHRYPAREELTAHLLAYARLAEVLGTQSRFVLDDGDHAPPQPAPTSAPAPAPTEPAPAPPPTPTSTGVIPLAGDFFEAGRADVGWWSDARWALTNRDHETLRFTYGRASDEAIVGEWNGDGQTTVGIRRGHTFYLSNQLRGGPADYSFRYGRDGDEILVGDWNGDGRDTIGLRRGATFYLSNAPRGGSADVTFTYGRADDRVVVGDWNGSGRTTVGVKRDNTYFLSNQLRGGSADYAFRYGWSSDTPLAGDFNGDGNDTISIVRGGTFHINDHPRGGPATRVLTPPQP